MRTWKGLLEIILATFVFCAPAVMAQQITATPQATQTQEPQTPAPKCAAEIQLPEKGGVFLQAKDAAPNGLAQIEPASLKLDGEQAQNFLKMQFAPFMIPMEGLYFIPGTDAKVQTAETMPTMYIRKVLRYQENESKPAGEFVLIKLKRFHEQDSRRIVCRIRGGSLFGKKGRLFDIVPSTTESTADGAFWKLRPTAALAPGNYGVAYLPKRKDSVDDVVYDFDVKPGF